MSKLVKFILFTRTGVIAFIFLPILIGIIGGAILGRNSTTVSYFGVMRDLGVLTTQEGSFHLIFFTDEFIEGEVPYEVRMACRRRAVTWPCPSKEMVVEEFKRLNPGAEIINSDVVIGAGFRINVQSPRRAD